MANILSKVKNGKDIRTKARVYFTAHPEGYEKYFERITKDILSLLDCAIFYTEDMAEPLSEENLSLDLGRMNLVVVPITLRLLTEENRAMSVDIPYSKKHGIPILPIMMEDGLLEIYSQADKFGELQYISPIGNDNTEVDYNTKLENRLLGTLTNDELAKRVHTMFDTHLFLSYRKRDRAYANRLLETIHNDERLRDVAVWYDEFLTPGESYIENIDIAMKESSLMLLLVTPNILEEPNFVKDTEYPTAREAGMTILPVMAAKTDTAELYTKYEGLPECIEVDDRLCDRIAEALRPVINQENNTDPERCFLLGIAYTDGIEVETNRKRGMELIRYSADAGYDAAVVFMYGVLHSHGKYGEALDYAIRHYEIYTEQYGDDEEKMMHAVDMLANAYRNAGKFGDVIPLFERKHRYYKEVLGEDHEQTLSVMTMLASTMSDAGNYPGALEMHKLIYEAQVARYGEKHPVSLISLAELATAYGNVGDYQKAFELKEKSFFLSTEYYGMASANGLTALNNYAFALMGVNDIKKAHELFEISYSVHAQVFGEEHPDTLKALTNLAHTTFMSGQRELGINLAELVLNSLVCVLGERHPDTVRAMDNLAYYNKRMGNIDRAIEINERSLALYKSVLGENHPSTATSMNNLGNAYVAKKDYAKGLALLQQAYIMRSSLIGEDHPRTIETLQLIVSALLEAGDYGQAKDIYPILIRSYMKTRPAGHPDRVVALYNLASCYYAVGDKANAATYMGHAYNEARIGYGDEHPKTRQYKQVLDMLTGE